MWCRVNITFVNYAGERTTLPGRVGDSLYEVARRFKYEFLDGEWTRHDAKRRTGLVLHDMGCVAVGCGGGGSQVEKFHKQGQWFELKYGEGAACSFCHVIIPKSHYELLPPKRPDEVQNLKAYPFQEDMTTTYVLLAAYSIL
jgi:hypothetical protein